MNDVRFGPETELPMVRDVRPFVVSYKGRSTTVNMPGWYCEGADEAVFTKEDMRVSDAALTELKAECARG